jgi:hypothetical protein
MLAMCPEGEVLTIDISLDGLKAWLKGKNVTSHTVAVVAIGAATLITTDQQVRNFLISILSAHPKALADISLLAAIILKYSHSSSPAGTVATAGQLLASPAAPTIEEVVAAEPPNPTMAATRPNQE